MHLRYMAAHVRIASRKDDPTTWTADEIAESFATLRLPDVTYNEWLAMISGEDVQPDVANAADDPVERLKNSDLVSRGIVTIEEYDADGRRIK